MRSSRHLVQQLDNRTGVGKMPEHAQRQIVLRETEYRAASCVSLTYWTRTCCFTIASVTMRCGAARCIGVGVKQVAGWVGKLRADGPELSDVASQTIVDRARQSRGR